MCQIRDPRKKVSEQVPLLDQARSDLRERALKHVCDQHENDNVRAGEADLTAFVLTDGLSIESQSLCPAPFDEVSEPPSGQARRVSQLP